MSLKQRTIKWSLFKESGKWTYSGTATFMDEDDPAHHYYYTDDDLVALIAAHQKEIVPRAILSRDYILVIDGCEDDPGTSFPFISRLIKSR